MKSNPQSSSFYTKTAPFGRLIKFVLFFLLLPVLSTINFQLSTLYAQQPTEEWVRRFNWNSFSGGLGVQLDTSGNVYVLMRLSNPSTSNDYGIAKYSPTGTLLWGVNYNSPGNLNDQPKEFAVSKTGDVYITGTTTITFESHIATVKFNTDGVLQWAKIYNGGGPGDAPTDIKIVNSGNNIVAGNTSTGSNAINVLTIKYNQNGDTLWVKKFTQLPDNSGTSKILTDTIGNIYLTGDYGYYLNLPDFLTIKYNSEGVLQWYSIYNSPQNYQDLGSQIALDSIGNIYVVGTTQVPAGAGHNDVLIKLNDSGIIQWTKVFRGIITGNGNGGYIVSDIAVSSDNNAIYYTILCPSPVANSEIVTIKYNNLGDSIWTKRYFGGVNGASNYPSALKLDKDNNIYVCGVGNHPVSGDDYVTIKYLPDGTQQWVALYNGPLSNSNDLCKGMYIDKNYNVYITGQSSYFNSGPILWEATTIKYSQPVGIEPISSEIPSEYKLYQNYPNPFNPLTKINYDLPNPAKVTLRVYDVLGRHVKTLVNEFKDAGNYTITFDGTGLASGIYFYKIEAGDYTDSRKMVLVK